MAKNADMNNAQTGDKDEFYTSFEVIEQEMNLYFEFNPDFLRGKTVLLPCDDPEWSNFTLYFAQNFGRLGLKKLISTSYAANAKGLKNYAPTLFESQDPQFDAAISPVRGKIFTLETDLNSDGVVDFKDLEWHYLEESGDFESDEVRALRDEADVIITNPPFSLWIAFLNWILEADKEFIILGNVAAQTYKDVFPLIRDNKIWMGPSISSGDREFRVPREYPLTAATTRVDSKGERYVNVKGVRWFTNIDHGRRHRPYPLQTAKDNLRFSRRKDFQGKTEYDRFDNYDAINVPFSELIPSDYDGVMGVPVTFLDKYCPDQFKIIGISEQNGVGASNGVRIPGSKTPHPTIDGKKTFARLFIQAIR